MNKLTIAFPTNDQKHVESHFGHCSQFAIFSINNNEIKNVTYVDAPAHAVGVLPKFLSDLKATTIITGGMGQRAIDLFKGFGIDVILGASGSIQDNLSTFLKGNLASNGTPCVHDHDENHSCNH